MAEVLETFSSVLTNMPHKVLLYASLVGLLPQDKAQTFVTHILQKTLPEVFNQDCFSSRSIFRWFGYLVDLKVIGQEDANNFLLSVLNHKSSQKNFALHCIMVAVTTENFKANPALSEALKKEFEERGKKEVQRQKLFGHSKADSLT